LQGGGAAGEAEAREGAFADADSGGSGCCRDEERSDEEGEVGIVADDQQVLGFAAFFEESEEVFEGGGGGQGLGLEDLGFVAGLSADEGGGLEAALEGARDDEVEADVKGIQNVGELRQWRLPSLSRGRLVSRIGLERAVPALACRRTKRFIGFNQFTVKGFREIWEISLVARRVRGGRRRGRARRGRGLVARRVGWGRLRGVRTG
jgi:hypothetical protein